MAAYEYTALDAGGRELRGVLEGDSARLRPARSRIARHFGAVTATGEALDARAEREAFERGVAEAERSAER